MKSKLTKSIAGGLVGVALVIGGAMWWPSSSNKPEVTSPSAQQAVSETANPEIIDYQGEEGKTALEMLKAKHSVVTETFSYGELVQSINGLEGTGPKYWSFYVNNKLADVGAGEYQTQATDHITWKLQQL